MKIANWWCCQATRLNNTRNPSYKKRTKKWASLDLAFFVQSFLIFQVDLVKSFLVSSRFIKIKTLK